MSAQGCGLEHRSSFWGLGGSRPDLDHLAAVYTTHGLLTVASSLVNSSRCNPPPLIQVPELRIQIGCSLEGNAGHLQQAHRLPKEVCSCRPELGHQAMVSPGRGHSCLLGHKLPRRPARIHGHLVVGLGKAGRSMLHWTTMLYWARGKDAVLGGQFLGHVTTSHRSVAEPGDINLTTRDNLFLPAEDQRVSLTPL